MTAASYAQAAGTGTTTFNGAQVYTGSFGFIGSALTVNGLWDVGGTTTVTNGGLFTTAVGDAAALTSDGIFTQNGVGLNSLGSNITTTNTLMTFGTGITLSDDVVLSTQGEVGVGNITLSGVVDAIGSGVEGLTLVAGSGTIAVTRPVGDAMPLGAFTVASSAQTDLANVIVAAGSIAVSATTGIDLNGTTYTSSGGAVTFTGAVALAAGAVTTVVTSGLGVGDAISFTSTVDDAANDTALTLTAGLGNISFGGVVGTNRLGAVTIVSAADVTATTSVTALSFTQVAGSGTTLLTGAVNTNGAGGVSLTGNVQTVNGTITTTGAGSVSFVNLGLLTVNADIVSDGAVTQSGAGLVTISAPRSITTTGDAVNILRAVSLGGGSSAVVSVATTVGAAGGANISFQSTVAASTAAPNSEAMTLDAGTGGNILFAGAVGQGGANSRLGALIITNANDVTESSAISAASYTQSSGTGATTFNSTQDYTGNFSFTGNALTVNAPWNVVGTTTIVNSGLFATAIGNVAALTSVGGMTQNGAGPNSFGSNITVTDNAIAIATAVTLTDNVVIVSGSGSQTYASSIDGPFSLTVSSSGVTTFGGPVGAVTPLSSIVTDSGGSTALDGGSVSTTGIQTYGDAVTLAADLIATADGFAFQDTVDSFDATPHSLTIQSITGGVAPIIFSAPIGAAGGSTRPLANLNISAGGALALNGIGTAGAQGAVGSLTISAGAAVELRGAAYSSGSSQSWTALAEGIRAVPIVDLEWRAASGAIALPGTTLYLDAPGRTLNLWSDLSARGIVAYRGSLNLNGRSIAAQESAAGANDGYIAIFGANYDPVDADWADAPANARFVFFPAQGFRYYPGAGT
ncbi:MAG: hypothetical protein Q8M65_06585, partial [Rhodoglobus sp.]|nr:hypothetical protein [Rhodoglobus sp.]